MEDNTFATKTFHSIDKRFALNATSMLNQTNTSLREDFSASQMSSDLLSYQKNSRVMQSTLTKLFETLKSNLASEIDVGPTIINFDFFPGLMTLLEKYIKVI